jgi:Spy/CpxP family protein refolding chaperone
MQGNSRRGTRGAVRDTGVRFVRRREQTPQSKRLMRQSLTRKTGETMKKTFLAAAAVLALGSTLAFATPQEDHHRGPGGPGHRGGRMDIVAAMTEKLSLTDAQKQQIAAIDKATHDANAAFFTTQRQTMQDFFAARQANDTAKLDSLKPVLDAQRAQMKTIRDAEMVKINTVLTADQKAKWAQIQAERETKHGRQ